MSFGSLFLIVGTGATIDALASLKNGKSSPVVVIVSATFLLLILTVVGGITKAWSLVGALAFLYLLASALVNFRQIPPITESLKGK